MSRAVTSNTVGFVFTHADFSGAPRMGHAWARACREAGRRVVALTGSPPAPGSGETSLVERLGALGVEVEVLPGLERAGDPRLLTRVFAWLCRERVGCAVSVQQATVKLAGWASFAAGVPWIYSSQATPRVAGGPLRRRLKRRALGLSLRRCARLVVCPSRAVEETLRAELGLPAARLRYLPNGIEVPPPVSLSPDERAAVRAELGVGPDELMLVAVARIDPLKAQHLAVEALAQARLPGPARLVLIGSVGVTGLSGHAEYERALRARVGRLGPGRDLVLPGWREDVPRLLAAADLCLHPSLTEGACPPLAVSEAMAARLPVVFTDCAGAPDGFQEGVHGFMVATGSLPSLVQGLERAAALEPAARVRMGEAARRLVEERLDIRALGRRFLDLLGEAEAST